VRILVADDDGRARNAVRALLQAQGYEVVLIDNGRDAVHAIAAGQFDVVILDIFLADIDGLETIRKFRKLYPDMPIIATSGLMFPATTTNPPDFLAMAAKLGAAGSLRKPFAPGELLNLLRACLRDDDDNDSG
jgi:DNA-binding response OmpR family regulator